MQGRGMPVYAGAAYQRGHGLGWVMKNMIRHATPILKQAGSQALKTGISVLAQGVLGNHKQTTPQWRKPTENKKTVKVNPKVLIGVGRRRRKRVSKAKDIFRINKQNQSILLHLAYKHWSVHIMTALVNPLSCACGKSELELFAVPPTQTAINSSQWMENRPITSLTDTGPIEFVIKGSGEEYVDLSETYLQVTAKIVKPTGGYLEQTLDDNGTVNGTDADVGPVNLWLRSLYSQVDVSLNDRLVTPSMNTYPYRAYLETLLSYGPAAKESYLSAALWYKDSAGHLEDR